MTKTSKCSQRLAHKLICIWVLLSSTHQVAQAALGKKSTKTKNSSSKSCKAKTSKSATLAVKSAKVLDECEGDCAGDDDNCDGDLKCKERTNNSDETVPGCKGKAIGANDYCYARPCDDYLWIFNDNDSLGECEGDCAGDDEKCEGDLKCKVRDDNDKATISGCKGKATGGNDYCYDRPTGEHLWIFNDNDSLGECEGDCAGDDDKCEGDLKCKVRDDNDKATVPGCRGKAIGGNDYCYEPKIVL